MVWMIEHKQKIRAFILVLMIVSFMGPWGFDKTNVPAQYACNPPSIRLEGDFCGHPISGFQNFIWIIGDFGNGIMRILKGEFIFDQTAFNLWIGLVYSLVVIFLILPIINNFVMLLRGERPRLQKLNLVVCGLNLVPVLLLGLLRYPNIYLALSWGVWLYFGLMISTLVLEGILLKLYSSKGQY